MIIYVMIGRVNQPVGALKSASLLSFQDVNTFEKQISKFWEIEEVNVRNNCTLDEKKCEDHYLKTVSRNIEGRYIVNLPVKENIYQVGESKSSAMSQFYSLERR